jgi:UDP-N-acetylglucosamine acyltransferase
LAADIHPTALVEAGARLGADVRIGPYCIVGAEAQLEDGVVLLSHAVIAGRTHIGAGCQVYPFASIGHAPQDLKYRGEPSTLRIGPRTIMREGVTIHPGTAGGGMATQIGADCLLMAHAHVGHDCRVGDHVILSNNVMLAGHVQVADHAILGGGVGVIQYARIGAHAFVGGLSGLEGDLIPFGLAVGNRAHIAGLNLVGLKRRGFTREQVAILRRAYRLLFADEGTLKERLDDVEAAFGADEHVAQILAFLRSAGERPVCKPLAATG